MSSPEITPKTDSDSAKLAKLPLEQLHDYLNKVKAKSPYAPATYNNLVKNLNKDELLQLKKSCTKEIETLIDQIVAAQQLKGISSSTLVTMSYDRPALKDSGLTGITENLTKLQLTREIKSLSNVKELEGVSHEIEKHGYYIEKKLSKVEVQNLLKDLTQILNYPEIAMLRVDQNKTLVLTIYNTEKQIFEDVDPTKTGASIIIKKDMLDLVRYRHYSQDDKVYTITPLIPDKKSNLEGSMKKFHEFSREPYGIIYISKNGNLKFASYDEKGLKKIYISGLQDIPETFKGYLICAKKARVMEYRDMQKNKKPLIETDLLSHVEGIQYTSIAQMNRSYDQTIVNQGYIAVQISDLRKL